MQETKLIDPDFPLEEIKQAGYHCVFSGQRTYNGVAILSREHGKDIVTDFPNLEDPQRRILGVTYGDVRILNLYIPNGESLVSAKYEYKLNWLQHLEHYLQQELPKYSKFILLGDFNIAPADIDVHDPNALEGQVLISDKERSVFENILKLGFQDCFRKHDQAEKSYSWWDYRLNAFKRNLGLRIDHILASVGMTAQCTQCYIDKHPRGWERPSDHAPVIAEFHA